MHLEEVVVRALVVKLAAFAGDAVLGAGARVHGRAVALRDMERDTPGSCMGPKRTLRVASKTRGHVRRSDGTGGGDAEVWLGARMHDVEPWPPVLT